MNMDTMTQARTIKNANSSYQKMAIPSLVSLSDELDMGLDFADFALSFLLSGEGERLTERVKKEEKHSSSK